MGKLNQFQIVLSHPQAVYFAGQWIQGHVILNLGEPMKMRGIYLDFSGAANVHWTETRSYTEHHGKETRTRTETIHYHGHEEYFKNKVILFGNAGGMFSDSTMHPQGHYTFPFSFQLPYSLPASFEGTYGSVRYFARCSIDRPWKFDHKSKQPFTVISILDLNATPDAMMVPQGQNSKTLCCLCCASGPIEAIVRLNRKGHVPGEGILINAEVTNGSSRRMDCTMVQLVQKVLYHATSYPHSHGGHHHHMHRSGMGTRWSTSVVAEKRHLRIDPGDSDSWSAEALIVPPLPPSGLLGCRIIDIHYVLKFVVDPSGPSTDLEVPLELTIGTIPLRSTFNDYTAAAAQAGYGAGYGGGYGAGQGTGYGAQYGAGVGANQASPSPAWPAQPNPGPSAPAMPLPPSAPPGAPPDAPPPSYQASVFGQVDIKDEADTQYTMGQTSYAPMYPTYNWNTTAYSLPAQPPPQAKGKR